MLEMDCHDSEISVASLLRAASCLPLWQHAALAAVILIYVLYNFLEIHLLWDLLTAFRSSAVELYYDHSSKVARHILPKLEILKGRYWSTPWLCSPHLQTAFLHFFGRSPTFNYRREIFLAPDGGTIALDWLVHYAPESAMSNSPDIENEETPIAIIIPGLTSDSDASYARHISHTLFRHGWNVVVANHRGLGGISITSDRFYNAGWTEDLRMIIKYLQHEHPKAPLMAVGTSIGANILVKYLGEEGENTPIAGAAAICCPWDLVVCDRFISRKFVQRLYDKILTTGLRGYAQMHQHTLSHFADWDCIQKSRSVRDFDHFCTIRVGKFETVDTYYRKCSSVHYLNNVSVPLLCVNALDDPVCTKEAIPWDECRANKNIILATTSHGGHLAYFEGFTARTIWWVGAVKEFLSVLNSSSLMHSPKKLQTVGKSSLLETSIDKGPYVNVLDDGMVCTEENSYTNHQSKKTENDQPRSLSSEKGSGDVPTHSASDTSVCKQEPNLSGCKEQDIQVRLHDTQKECSVNVCIRGCSQINALQSVLHQILDQIYSSPNNTAYARIESSKKAHDALPRDLFSANPNQHEDSDPGSSQEQLQKQRSLTEKSNITLWTVTKALSNLKKKQHLSIWILAYLAVTTTWPLVGSLLVLRFRRKFGSLWKLRK